MGKIAVIGTGYVGLTTGACFAHLGHEVICADIDVEKVARLNRGEIPIHEPGLDRVVEEGRASGRLTFVVGAAKAARTSEFAYLCVPTPEGPDGSADLSYIEAAAREIGPVLPAEAVVVNKSTVPVGSTRVVERALGRSDVFVVSNPEFLREGNAVSDFLQPDRVVIGADDQSAAVRVAALYVGVPAPLMVTDPASAETIKYACNAFLATKLSFVNAVAAICEAVGADVNDVILGMGYDKRIGHEFLRPGPGWGGSCFPKDTKALIHIAENHGYAFRLLRGVVEVNDEQFARTAEKVVRMVGGSIDGVKIAAWGLTFKARTDDLRMSPSLEVIGRLLARGARVRAHDPAIGAGSGHRSLEGID
ncbi:MAG: UDPglucose 6-dehydrogenase, partial [Acidimicrobiia bacterium]|nr:UDPglucose 6-dehydrogenase [Acidimicrobiia bacterium]